MRNSASFLKQFSLAFTRVKNSETSLTPEKRKKIDELQPQMNSYIVDLCIQPVRTRYQF